MKKIIQIAVHEYKRQVARKAFIGALLFPLFMIGIAVVIGLISANVTINSDKGVVGYVDPSDALAGAVQPPADGGVTFQKFAAVEEARAALQDKRIIAYYALAPDFAVTRNAEFYYWQNEPGNIVRRAFERFARTALLAKQGEAVAVRLIEGAIFTYATPDGTQRSEASMAFSILLPMFVAILFIVALFSGASYLMQAVVDEKENRTIEVVVTSVAPTQLMAGKVLGLAAVGLTQITAWLIGILVAVLILRDRVEFPQGVTVEPGFIALALVLFILQYLLYGGIMAGIGAIVADIKQGQSYSSPFTLLAMVPFFFMTVILFDPNGTIAVILSLFPLTAPMTLLLRHSLTSVPAWQTLLSIALMAVSAVVAMWLASRIFRIGMLRFGQRMSVSEIAAAVRF